MIPVTKSEKAAATNNKYKPAFASQRGEKIILYNRYLQWLSA
jgi:hypothetical protein